LRIVDESGGALDAGAGVVVEEVGLRAEDALTLVVHLVAGVAAAALLEGTVEGRVALTSEAGAVVEENGSAGGTLTGLVGGVPDLLG
jgi:hypothetical protein